jgi:hypothetical protein
MDVVESIFAVSSNPKTWQELRSADGARRYCAKYACKPYQKNVPVWFRDVGRFWGSSTDVKQNRERPKIVELTEDELREILRAHNKKAANFDVLPKYLWGIEQGWLP